MLYGLYLPCKKKKQPKECSFGCFYSKLSLKWRGILYALMAIYGVCAHQYRFLYCITRPKNLFYFAASSIRRATLPVTLAASPKETPLSLKRRSISAMVASPIFSSLSLV